MRAPARALSAFAVAALATLGAAQTDHDNLDANRPLRFEDAEPMSYRGLAFEYGLGISLPRRRPLGFDGGFEIIYGIAINSHLEIGIDPSIGGRPGSDNTRGRIDAYEIAYLYNFSQELRNTPALAVKVEASLPGVSGERAAYRVRGIASRTVGAYSRLHVNLDADFQPDAPAGTRRVRVGGVLGYTNPIGYPREFNTTGLAEIAFIPGVENGQGTTVSFGLGVRRQISPRSVLDIGVQSDVAPGRGVSSTPFRLIAGYSTSF